MVKGLFCLVTETLHYRVVLPTLFRLNNRNNVLFSDKFGVRLEDGKTYHLTTVRSGDGRLGDNRDH